MNNPFISVWLLLGVIYLGMTFYAYGKAKPEHKMAVLSGWWCFFRNYFPEGHDRLLLTGKMFMSGILVCALVYFTDIG